jgi:hypothetical protein
VREQRSLGFCLRLTHFLLLLNHLMNNRTVVTLVVHCTATRPISCTRLPRHPDLLTEIPCGSGRISVTGFDGWTKDGSKCLCPVSRHLI